jgi:hypothetical protein
MRDTRHLFMEMCSRKEASWDSIPQVRVDDERMRILMGLPMQIAEWNTSPMSDSLIRKPHRAPGLVGAKPMELIIQRVGEEDVQYFYVNTEGYGYVRYAFRFEPRTV